MTDLSKYIPDAEDELKKPLRRSLENILMDTVNDRHLLMKDVCNTFPGSIIHPEILHESILQTNFQFIFTKSVQDHIINKLIQKGLFRRYNDTSLSTFQEYIISLMMFPTHDRNEKRLFLTVLPMLKDVIASYINFTELQNKLDNTTINLNGLKMTKITIGTQDSIRGVKDQLRLYNAFCYNYVDSHGNEKNRHVYNLYESHHPFLRSSRFQSPDSTHEVNINIELPVRALFASKTRIKTVDLKLGIVNLTLIYPNDPSYILKGKNVLYQVDNIRLPCISSTTYIDFFLDNDDLQIARIKLATMFGFVAYLLETNELKTNRNKVEQLLRWNIIDPCSSTSMFLENLSTKIRQVISRSNTLAYQKKRFHLDVQSLIQFLRQNLIISLSVKRLQMKRSITYVSPYTLA